MRALHIAAGLALVSLTGLASAQPSGTHGEGVYHARVCPGPGSAGSARCHAHVVTDAKGNPMATAGPSGFKPADLRAAYNVTSSGSSSTLIAIVDAYGYPTAESDLAKYRAQFGLPACTTAN